MHGFKTKPNTIISAIQDLETGALFIFIGIVIRFITENTLNALVFLNILQPGDSSNRYDIHSPSPPDMIGDVVTIILFTLAYFFGNTTHVQNAINISPENDRGKGGKYAKDLAHLHEYHLWTEKLFRLTMIGFGLYFFSKYVLSTGLEVVFINNTGLSSALGVVSNVIQIVYPFIFVYVFCDFLSTNKITEIVLYLFFLVRNLLGTNFLGFITRYDLHVGAPFVDVLSPVLIIYSIVCIFARSKTHYQL